jgi:lipopolysaccharide assembly outer membrane protein LptD (OstA)
VAEGTANVLINSSEMFILSRDNPDLVRFSVFYKRENSLDAFGHVRIFDIVDSVNITSERLEYDGDSRIANLRENVVYKEDSVILTTDFLDYDIYDRSAFFSMMGPSMMVKTS